MTYVNTTGKHIGECLTGFGSSYPVVIYNSGNSDVEYAIDVKNNTNVFSTSNSELIINNGSTGVFYIFYKPTITASAADETADFTIFGQSVEDGAIDPSGLITINATGSRIITNTAGAVRKFVALKNYDVNNGINYDFSWLPPTGTGSLKNYYFTGYQLDIATGTDFVTNTVFTTGIISAQNTTNNPKFASFYGYPELENTVNVSKKDFPTLILDTGYYARIYTYSTNNTGISIYATGIDSVSEQLSEEVINGNSGVKPNIEFKKKALNVYIENGNYVNYDLSQKILKTNQTISDFTFYSGINVYFPGNSTFSSKDENSYAVDLNNVVLQNFTGDANGTFINFYIPYNCNIIGNFGKGGDIITSDVWVNSAKRAFLEGVLNKTTAEYNKTNPTLSDSKSGGNVLKLDAKTDKDIKDFIYNIYTEKNSFIAAGGGGNKAGIAEIAGVGEAYGLSSDNLIKGTLYQLNGAFNKYGINTKYDLFRGQATHVRNGDAITTSSTIVASFFSNKSEYGEDGSNTFYFKYLDQISTFSFSRDKYYQPEIYTNVNSFPIDGNPRGLSFVSMPGAVSQAGNLIKKYSNSSLRYSLYNTDIPTDYIFRLENSLLTSSSSWVAQNNNASTIFTLNTLSGGVSYNSNFNSTGYRALTITNGSLSGLISGSSTCKNFDLYLVGCFGGTMTPPKTFNLINWYADATKISKKHVNFKQFTDTNVSINNFAESNTFNFFTSLLYNFQINNEASKDFFLFNKGAENSYYQLSKCLNTSSFTIYPFILNIKRTGSVYTIYVNGQLHTFYDLNFSTELSARNINNFISEILSTTFRLENNDTAMSTSFFDILCYNRVLFNDENRKVNNHLLQSYMKLFTGIASNSYLNITDRVRFPNIFNLAGKISSL
jgi:hypothetical protein